MQVTESPHDVGMRHNFVRLRIFARCISLESYGKRPNQLT